MFAENELCVLRGWGREWSSLHVYKCTGVMVALGDIRMEDSKSTVAVESGMEKKGKNENQGKGPEKSTA